MNTEYTTLRFVRVVFVEIGSKLSSHLWEPMPSTCLGACTHEHTHLAILSFTVLHVQKQICSCFSGNIATPSNNSDAAENESPMETVSLPLRVSSCSMPAIKVPSPHSAACILYPPLEDGSDDVMQQRWRVESTSIASENEAIDVPQSSTLEDTIQAFAEGQRRVFASYTPEQLDMGNQKVDLERKSHREMLERALGKELLSRAMSLVESDSESNAAISPTGRASASKGSMISSYATKCQSPDTECGHFVGLVSTFVEQQVDCMDVIPARKVQG